MFHRVGGTFLNIMRTESSLEATGWQLVGLLQEILVQMVSVYTATWQDGSLQHKVAHSGMLLGVPNSLAVPGKIIIWLLIDLILRIES